MLRLLARPLVRTPITYPAARLPIRKMATSKTPDFVSYLYFEDCYILTRFPSEQAPLRTSRRDRPRGPEHYR